MLVAAAIRGLISSLSMLTLTSCGPPGPAVSTATRVPTSVKPTGLRPPGRRTGTWPLARSTIQVTGAPPAGVASTASWSPLDEATGSATAPLSPGMAERADTAGVASSTCAGIVEVATTGNARVTPSDVQVGLPDARGPLGRELRLLVAGT